MSQWYVGTLVKSQMVADDVKSLTFHVPDWPGHKSGQHCDLRLTAENGYQAERKYSIASPPQPNQELEFGIQLLPGGEVSPYLFHMNVGEELEIRGPLGGHFIWDHAMPGALVLIGGGSGMVPLMSMLRHYLSQPDQRPVRFLISARSLEHVLFYPELTQLSTQHPDIKIITTLTDEAPQNWSGYKRRVDQAMLTESFGDLKESMPMIYVCGPTPFVEAVADQLLLVGFNTHAIRTERFGGTGK